MDLRPALTARRLRLDVDASACEMDDLAPCGGVDVTVGGDVAWAPFVQRAAQSGWPGVERLAQVPGTVADVVRANAEVHGQAVAGVVASVGTWDRAADRARTFAWVECEFGPGTSRFQELLADGRERYDVLDVSFLFQLGDRTTPIEDPELAASLGIAVGDRVALADYAARASAARQVGPAS